MVDVLSSARQLFLRLPTFSRPQLRGGNLFLRAGEVSFIFSRDSDLVLSFDAALDFFGQAHDARTINFFAGRAGRVRLLVELQRRALAIRQFVAARFIPANVFEVAIKLARVALCVRVRLGRSAGSSLAKIFRVV